MLIKNINGTSQTRCSCGPWLRHWEIYSGQKTKFCCEKACINKNLVGAHVQRANSSDQKWYILPLCKKHNQDPDVIEVLDTYKLVSANKSETCEK